MSKAQTSLGGCASFLMTEMNTVNVLTTKILLNMIGVLAEPVYQ